MLEIDDNSRVLSFRTDDSLAQELETAARIERVSLSAMIRAAGYRYLTALRTDENFQARRREYLAREIERLHDLGPEGKS